MIPNTKNNQEQLSEAEQKSSNGVQVYMEIDPDGEGQTSGGEINTYDFQQNWGAAEKEKQRQRDQNETRILPGPASNSITPPSTGNRPQLNSDEVNNQQIWRDEESTDYEAIPNPYDFDWADEDADSFLP